MSARLWVAAIVVGGGGLLVPHNVMFPAPAAVARDQDRLTTLDDQVELAVTVYNSDIALIRDVRNLDLTRGTSDLRFMDIAATVNPATVHFRSVSEPASLSVLEQNYEYDLLEPEKSEEHTSELQSRLHLVCRLLLEKKKTTTTSYKV